MKKAIITVVACLLLVPAAPAGARTPVDFGNACAKDSKEARRALSAAKEQLGLKGLSVQSCGARESGSAQVVFAPIRVPTSNKKVVLNVSFSAFVSSHDVEVSMSPFARAADIRSLAKFVGSSPALGILSGKTITCEGQDFGGISVRVKCEGSDPGPAHKFERHDCSEPPRVEFVASDRDDRFETRLHLVHGALRSTAKFLGEAAPNASSTPFAASLMEKLPNAWVMAWDRMLVVSDGPTDSTAKIAVFGPRSMVTFAVRADRLDDTAPGWAQAKKDPDVAALLGKYRASEIRVSGRNGRIWVTGKGGEKVEVAASR